jgi:3-phosphoshikimate 1-carboxyvinyltransferase
MPGDKSISHRVLMLSAIAQGDTTIHDLNAGEDVGRTSAALAALGVSMQRRDGHTIVRGGAALRQPTAILDCGNSGTTIRMLMGLLAGRVAATLDGDASLRRRPMERVAEPLRSMGARIATRDGRPPVTLQDAGARLRGIDYAMPVASAQVRTALLLAGLRADGETSVSSPDTCRDHTERMLAAMGARLAVQGNSVRVSPSQLAALGDYRVPGDLSAAVFFLAGAAVAEQGGRLVIDGVGVNPTRTAALDVLREMGLRVGLRNYRERFSEPIADLDVACGVEHGASSLLLDPDFTAAAINEIPTLCAVAGVLLQRFSVRGAAELRAKESDRIAATVSLLGAFGIESHERPDGIDVLGTRGRPLHAPQRVSTGGDHRIGMAAAVLALAGRAQIEIEDAGCIATSFPDFERTWTRAFAR